MSQADLRNITHRFQDVRLVSLRSWPQASRFEDCDEGGPYMISQEGFDPADLTMEPDEFVLGKSGQWLSLSHFLHLPADLRRDEFVFCTAAEVMELLESLP